LVKKIAASSNRMDELDNQYNRQLSIRYVQICMLSLYLIVLSLMFNKFKYKKVNTKQIVCILLGERPLPCESSLKCR